MPLPIHIPEVLEHLMEKAEAIRSCREAIATYID